MSSLMATRSVQSIAVADADGRRVAACWIKASDSESRLDVASSRMRMGASARNARARNPPNNSTSASVPFETRCASAHSTIATNIGCFRTALMRPGKYAANSRGNAGNSNAAAR